MRLTAGSARAGSRDEGAGRARRRRRGAPGAAFALLALVLLESNWLPAPLGRFILMMWLYWPKEKAPSILDGTWKPPAVARAS